MQWQGKWKTVLWMKNLQWLFKRVNKVFGKVLYKRGMITNVFKISKSNIDIICDSFAILVALPCSFH